MLAWPSLAAVVRLAPNKKRLLAGLLTKGLVAILLAQGCGGSDGNPIPTAPTPPTPAGQTTFTGNVPAFGITSHELAVSRDEALVATLTWTARLDLDLYLTDASCTGYPPDACAILARSVEETGTREELSRSVKAGERYKLWVDNLSRTSGADYRLDVTIR